MNLFIIPILCCSVVRTTAEVAKVQVKQGWLVGERLRTIVNDSTYYSFKGIPYAEPPIGLLRFKAPRPPSPWKGIRSAKKHGHVCHQTNLFTDEIILGREDCLYLNVYTPNLNPNRLLAVMVFIHGGAYQTGSGNVDNYAPDFLVRKNVVLVTFNYRLGALGFLSLDTADVPGNAGLKDQVAALKWVQTNIRRFGGDPRRVTIFGQNAGAASVGYHLLSPLSTGLFQRAIPMSGSPYCDWSTAYYPRKKAFKLAQDLGFETENVDDLLEFLHAVEAIELDGNLPSVFVSEEAITNPIKLTQFPPVVEKLCGPDTFLPDEPRNILKAGLVNRVDIMFGYTDKEGLIMLPLFEDYLLERYNRFDEMLVPTKILFTQSPITVLEIYEEIRSFYFKNMSISAENMNDLIDYTSNVTFVYDIHRFFRDIPRNRCHNMYFYKFSSVSDRNYYGNTGALYGIKGASHGDDLLYLFNAQYLNMTVVKNSIEYDLIDQFTTLITNFAKYGNPTPDRSFGFTWPQFDNRTCKYVNIGQNLQIGSRPDKDDVDFWKAILEYAGIPFFV